MESQLIKILEVQKESWNKSSGGWKKWDPFMMNFLKPVGDEMISMLGVENGHHILDIATGTGEPGISIAKMLDGGKVVGTDLSEDMLTVAIENATKQGICNFETVCCDVSAMPFDNQTFDAISCRCGFMFFPDMDVALSEMIRVLKPGGRIIAAVWNVPQKNFWIAVSMETMISRLQLKPPAPGAPGLFRCAEQGYMTALFRKAGLQYIHEKEVAGKLSCNTIDTYWNFISEVASPTAFSKADESIKQQIKNEVLDKALKRCPTGSIAFDSNAIVIAGVKKQ